MIRYRVGAPVRLRAFCNPYIKWALRGERRRLWSAALYHFTPIGKTREAAFRARVLGMFSDRIECEAADRVLRAAWSPARGDS